MKFKFEFLIQADIRVPGVSAENGQMIAVVY